MLWIRTAMCSHTSATVAGWHTVRNPVRADAPGLQCALSRTASQNATHVSFVSACTVRASWEHPCDRDHQLMMERRDRVGNVALGSDRRRRGVGNYREWQVF